MIVEASGRETEDTELCIRLRRRFDMPLLLVGSLSTESACVAAYGAGVDECISGPVSDELLRAKVRVWLRWTRRSFGAQDSLSPIHAYPQTTRMSDDG